MTPDQIHDVLNKMLIERKSREFLNHLVRAYVPINKISKVLDTPEGDFKCVITKTPLSSISSIIETLNSDEQKNIFNKELKTFITDEGINVSQSLGKIIGTSQLAVTGVNTNTHMSYDSFQVFYTWVLTKSLEGNKHINWLLGSIRRDKLAKAAKIEDPKLQKKLKGDSFKQSTYTLAQMNSSLANLKLKLLNQEKIHG